VVAGDPPAAFDFYLKSRPKRRAGTAPSPEGAPSKLRLGGWASRGKEVQVWQDSRVLLRTIRDLIPLLRLSSSTPPHFLLRMKIPAQAELGRGTLKSIPRLDSFTTRAIFTRYSSNINLSLTWACQGTETPTSEIHRRIVREKKSAFHCASRPCTRPRRRVPSQRPGQVAGCRLADQLQRRFLR
jgi:hypothetical protein